MAEHPILFSAPMVRAILEGRKTQTRRVIKLRNDSEWHVAQHPDGRMWPSFNVAPDRAFGEWYWLKAPYGDVNDLLWVRETWQHAPQQHCSCPQPSEASPCDDWSEGTGCRSNRGSVIFRADDAKAPRWRPAIHMPRSASRITLRITGVRVETLQDISEADASAEGSQEPTLVPIIGACWSERDAYAKLWEHINGKGSWDANPWVWVIEFERVTHAVRPESSSEA